ncbi:hypothetical protein [Kiloniella sp.]|uniref:hypothetical protein n=1 Tax=Kiloniella sp. TaxID=1938587 RepID=UPI003B029DD0
MEEDFLKSTVTAALGAGLVYAAIFIAAYIKKRPPIFAGDAWLFAPTGFLLGPTGLTFALFVNIPLAIAHRYYLAKKRNRSMWRSYAPVAPAYCLAVGIVFGMQVHMGEML